MPDDTKAFEGLVQEKTGKKVLSAWKALFRGGGKVLSKSGLLCAVEGGLVFAEEKFGKPGLVAPFPAQGISSFRVEDSDRKSVV